MRPNRDHRPYTPIRRPSIRNNSTTRNTPACSHIVPYWKNASSPNNRENRIPYNFLAPATAKPHPGSPYPYLYTPSGSMPAEPLRRLPFSSYRHVTSRNFSSGSKCRNLTPVIRQRNRSDLRIWKNPHPFSEPR